MNKKLYIGTLVLTAVLAGSAFAGSAQAASNDQSGNAVKAEFKANMGRPGPSQMGKGMLNRKSMIVGSVTTISGTTLTVSGRSFGAGTSTVLYTVNTSGAKVNKAGATSTVASIVVGDTVMVEGTITGTSVTATMIRDTVTGRGMGGPGGMGDRKGGMGSSTIPEGNGQPIVGGTVSAVNGLTITITNKSNVSYSIDATNAKVTKNGKAGTIADVTVGDSVLAQGTVNGNSVVAVSITDSVAKTPGTNDGKGPQGRGFFGAIGNFFSHLFGF